jgi:flavin-dependent dehydrogenase
VNSKDEVASYIMARSTQSVSYEPAKSFITKNVYCSKFNLWIAKNAIDAGAELKTSTLITRLMKEDGKVVGVIDEKGLI